MDKKYESNLLPKLNGEGKTTKFTHLYICELKLRENLEEDVRCRFFWLKFEGRIQGWYEALPAKSIRSWKQFREVFLAGSRE